MLIVRLVPSLHNYLCVLRLLGRPERGNPPIGDCALHRPTRRLCVRAPQESLTQRRLGVSVSLGASVERRAWLDDLGSVDAQKKICVFVEVLLR